MMSYIVKTFLKGSIFRKNQDCAFVMCQAEAVDVNMKHLYTMKRVRNNYENLFEDLIMERNVFCTRGIYDFGRSIF